MKAIVNTTVVLSNYMILDGIILIDGDRIVEVGERKDISIPKGTELLDVGGNYTGPGLIDIHTHAGGGAWFYDDPNAAAQHHLKHGTTSLLPALYFDMDKDQYLKSIKKIREYMDSTDQGKVIKGLYMEGPYLNPKYGAAQEDYKWFQGVQSEDYLDIINEVGDFAKVWCIAPELDGILDFVRAAKQKIKNLIFAVAHSEASPTQIEACIPFGLCLGTHHTNATGNLVKYPECRGVSVDETVNFHDDMYAELICDSKGIHVDPYMLRLVLKIKGRDKIILISDACVFDGPIPPGYEGVNDINFDYSEQIAGSKLTLDVACKNMMKHTGSSLCDVFVFASSNPAKLLGMSKYGQIKKGNVADLVVVNHMMGVQKVIFKGNEVS